MNGRNRRRKDVPFNPFAPKAAEERVRRQVKRESVYSNDQNTASRTPRRAVTLEELKRKARQKLSQDLDNNIFDYSGTITIY